MYRISSSMFLFHNILFYRVFVEVVTILLLFYVFGFFFDQEACGVLAPQPKIEPAPPCFGRWS